MIRFITSQRDTLAAFCFHSVQFRDSMFSYEQKHQINALPYGHLKWHEKRFVHKKILYVKT